MFNRRNDQPVAGLPNLGCSAPYQGNPVYQTMWLKLAGSGNNYELGTGHQCNDQYRYWFWGLSSNGVFTSLGTQVGIANGVQHTFQMDRQATGPGTYAIYYRIDGVTKRTLATGAVLATTLDVGLESYCQGCVVDGYSNQNLKYLKAGIWSFWAGEDGKQINDPPMCGHWAGGTIWWSGEEAAC